MDSTPSRSHPSTPVRRTSPATVVDLLRAVAEDQGDRLAYTFLVDGEHEGERLTWAELDLRASRLATELQAAGATGERVLLLYPPGLDFVTAFFGCLYAGAVAVPADVPRSARTLPRLLSIADDARAALALTDGDRRKKLERLCGGATELAQRWMTWSGRPDATGGTDLEAPDWQAPEIDGETLAFLQYTSGSTAAPKGVEIRHANLLHNEAMIGRAFGVDRDSVIVGWLPLFHDMGLIGNVLQPLWAGASCHLMSPMAFLSQPLRWLRAISEHRATVSGGPNFAYDLCVSRISAEDRATLDLSSWRVAFNGAEPVRAETLERFAATFAECGFDASAFYPCYGLAEATLFVTGGEASEAPRVASFDPGALEGHRVDPVAEGEGRRLVSSGAPWLGQELTVVDPETLRSVEEGRVGEIWVAGPSIALGYWGQDRRSREELAARRADEPSAGPFLRTGDLGFLHGGELFVAGRLKDLIIIRGRNHYPQDLELTAEQAHTAVQGAGCAAFSVDVADEEQLVLVAEIHRHAGKQVEEIADAIRQAVAEGHELRIHEVVLIRPGSLPRTTSGKVQRHACRTAWRDDRLTVVGRVLLADEVSTPSPLEAEAVSADESSPALASKTVLQNLRQRLLALPASLRPGLLDEALWPIVAAALRRDAASLDRGRSLTAQGLDSLAAVEIEHRFEDQHGFTVSALDLLAGASLDEVMASLLEGLETDRTRTPEPHPDAEGAWAPEVGRDGFPLSLGQEALWSIHRASGRSSAYHIVALARVRPALDRSAFERALCRLVERHPMLRTTFDDLGGEPRRQVHRDLVPEIRDLSAAADSGASVQERLEIFARQPFDLARGPLVRFAWGSEAGDEATGEEGAGDLLLLGVHHLVADFWSLAVMVRELEQLYAAERSGHPVELAPLAAGYGDFVTRQHASFAGPAGEATRRWWCERLAPFPTTLDLATDRPRTSGSDGVGRGAIVSENLPAAELAAVEALAAARGTTLFATLMGGFQALMSRFTGQRRLLVGAPSSGREEARLAPLVGYFVNTLVHPADFSRRPTVAEFLDQTRDEVLATLAHRELPLAQVVEALRSAGRNVEPGWLRAVHAHQQAPPWAPVELAGSALAAPGARLDFDGHRLEALPVEGLDTPFELVLRTAVVGGELVLSLQYAADLWDAASAQRMVRHYRRLLGAASAQPEARLDELSLFGDSEREQLMGWAEAPAAEATVVDPVVHRRCLAVAAVHGERLALRGAEGSSTYAQLAERSGRLARRLRTLGVGAETRVAVLARRSVSRVTALLAIWRAGGAYVPLDPAHPSERLAYMVADAGAEVLIVDDGEAVPAELRRALTDTAEILDLGRLDRDRLDTTTPPEGAPVIGEPEVDPDQLAYVVYTSGSTGRPKGVAISHRTLSALIDWHLQTYRLTPEDRATHLAGFSFDAAVWEIWPVLASGASLHLPGETVGGEPAALVRWMAEHRITQCFLPTPLAEAVIDELGSMPEKPTLALRSLLTGGDRLRTRPTTDLGFELINHYGPTENTVVATAGMVGSVGESLPHIGRPIAGVRVELLSREGKRVPLGGVGEIVLGGGSLARGYLGQPALTAACFVPDPAGAAGSRLYRTGDLARWSAEGQLDFLGRADHQVKVRGHRIELGEIEAVLAEHSAVETAVVLPRTEGSRGDLVAFVVLRPSVDATASSQRLAKALGDRLPAAMVPAHYVALDALPLTPNGKIDRVALGELARPGAATATATIGRPRTPIEEGLVALCAPLLEIESPSLDASFFDLGGHSLSATRLVARIVETFGVELSLRDLFEASSLRRLATRIEKRLAADHGRSEPIPRIPRRRQEPLSPAQRRLWILDRSEPGRSAAYNIPGALDLTGELDVGALARALDTIVARHEVLRTRIRKNEDGEPIQVLADSGSVLETVDLGGLSGEVETRLAALEAAMATRRFDLAEDSPIRALLVHRGAGEATLLLTLHHIVADGWSLGVLLDELAALYTAELRGGSSPLEALPVQYHEVAAWERSRSRGAAVEHELDYWRVQLAAPTVLELPTDRPRTRREHYRGGRRGRRLEQGGAVVEALGRRHGATPFMVFAAALSVLLSRLSGQQDVILGSPVANRQRTELEPLIAFLVNTLALRIDVDGSPSFGQVLERTRQTALDAYAHQGVPFDCLVEELAPERVAHHSPIFQVLLAQQDVRPGELDLPGLQTRLRGLDAATAKLDLTVRIDRRQDQWVLEAEYDAELFDGSTIERWLGHLDTLLCAATATPNRAAEELDLLSRSERHQLLRSWNEVPSSQALGDVLASAAPTVHGRFAEQAARTPEAIAVACGDDALSYAELAERSHRLAHHLRSLGVGVESRVGFCLRRRPEQFVALLAILEAGGAFVPLDPEAPADRVVTILRQAGARILVTDSQVRADLGEPTETCVALDDDAEAIAARSAEPLAPSAGAGNLAYVLFTSGSTGVPKGVMVEHGSLVHLSDALRASAYHGLAPGQRVAINASLVFDAAVKQWIRLLHGDRLELIPEPVRLDSRRMVAFLARRQVSVLDVTPTQLRYLLAAGLLDRCGEFLQRILVGGEEITPELWQELAADPERRFRNVYGPTECTVDSSWATVGGGAATPRLGGPLPRVRLYALDRRLRPALPGSDGELVIGGAGVTRGYLAEPRRTAESFVPDPWPSQPGARLYRSGDRVRRRADGGLEFRGRLDRQVKLRGFRIELGEVEAALTAAPEVREAAVLLRQDEGGEPRLVAYVAPAPEAEVDSKTLGRWLVRRLPAAMVPTVFVVLDALPRSAAGKVQRRALPIPEQVQPHPEATVKASQEGAPRSPLEEVLVGMMAEILGLESVGIHDNFFELGGHSLLAAELNSLVQEAFEIELPMFQILLESPTVASIAEYLLEDPERRAQVEEMAPLLLELAEIDDESSELLAGVSA